MLIASLITSKSIGEIEAAALNWNNLTSNFTIEEYTGPLKV
jgi:hypothetical protein